ncbi:DarT ssDNA thymidine ADP-ribosyltransferase family protein [Acinetobacter pittii]|uniref:DarT ssDNA thymidine ADP-ribosyltransferase family protein n=1 Tax=Acinetobacter pittii TaxID=48296 RepID=UPI00192A7A14|nr:DarT ssDNA thymidine ADP-ribosyltransferase family protein [Acinetobacter pittii]
MSLSEAIKQKGIEEVLHFTTNRGIVGILATGYLASRAGLKDHDLLEHVLHVNAKDRPEASELFDKSENWLDFVNLSISEINQHYFQVSKRWHIDQDVWWLILSFDSEIINHEGVYFATTNNSYPYCKRGKGIEGFELLFQNIIKRKYNWSVVRSNRKNNLPTCQQAEVLYPKKIPINYLKKVYVNSEDNYDRVKGWLRQFNLLNVEVEINSNKFNGRPN